MHGRINFPMLAGGVCGFLAVLLGAYVEHGLKGRLSPHDRDSIATALRYQLVHALLLVALGIAGDCLPRDGGRTNGARHLRLAAGFIFAGIVLFSGGIELSVLTGSPEALRLAPTGGVAFMLGWLILASLGVRRRAC